MDKYDHNTIEKKWQKQWEEWGLYQAIDFSKKPKKYLLIEFPYPSGERLHVGHGRSYCCLDAMARLSRMKGFNVLYPIGWDAFGLPAENFAIKTGINPVITTKQNIATARSQAKSWGLSFDWSREINTTDPNYYEWTQWIFLQLFKKGLAYRSEVMVNWCPKCQTNLADEEVLSDGTHERCGEKTEKRMQKQWLIKITAYAERLLKDLDLVNFRDDIRRQQVNWIGKSEGAEIEFPIVIPAKAGIYKNNLNKQGLLLRNRFQIESGMTKSNLASQGEALRGWLPIKVFTTRLDTIFGATFLVLAPENSIIEKIKNKIEKRRWKEVEKYIKISLNKSELERISKTKERTGVFTGTYAINPLNNEKIPIFIADYVVMSYGTGAIMGVPAHDLRDFAFAKKYGLKIVEVVKPEATRSTPGVEPTASKEIFTGYGVLVNSGDFSGLTSEEAIKRILKYIENNHLGRKKVNYHLRDWVFSRQHYWGEPIPIIHCPKCGEVAVPEKDLPVVLPYVEKYQPSGTGESPLSKVADWVNTKCPNCGGPARRETDTMPNWAGSNWYFLGYIIAKKLNSSLYSSSPSTSFTPSGTEGLGVNFARSLTKSSLPTESGSNNKNQVNIFKDNKDLLKYWLPIDLYNGGMEHTTLHLLYSRFIYKFLYDCGCVPTPEPYARRWSHGVVLGPDGAKMSKSKGNVINPDEIVKKYGADTFRLYEGFMGPFEQMIVWDEKGVKGCSRFLNRVWRLVTSVIPDEPQARSGIYKNNKKINIDSGFRRNDKDGKLWRLIYKTTKKVESDIWHLSFNTAIASLMELLNAFYASRDEVTLEMLKHYLLLLAPFAPFITEELWNRIRVIPLDDPRGSAFTSIHTQPWPKYEEKLLKEEKMVIPIQVNGKLRDVMEVRSEECENKEKIEKLSANRARIAKYLQGKKIKKVIYVPGRLINFVI